MKIKELILERPVWQTTIFLLGISFVGSLFVCGFSELLFPCTTISLAILSTLTMVVIR